MKKIMICLLSMFLLWTLAVSASAAEEGIAVGGIRILKTDLTGQPLEGAVFQLARDLQEGEFADRRVEKKLLKIGGENRVMAMEAFWPGRDMTGEKQLQITTDGEGKGAAFGLPFCTYYLVETAAPEGYNRIRDPIRITVHKYSHLAAEDNVRDDKGVLIDNTLHIVNVRYTLPDTGSLETVQLAAALTGILFSAAALILMNRRRWH